MSIPTKPFEWTSDTIYNPRTGQRDQFLTVRKEGIEFQVVVPAGTDPNETIKRDYEYHRSVMEDI